MQELARACMQRPPKERWRYRDSGHQQQDETPAAPA